MAEREPKRRKVGSSSTSSTSSSSRGGGSATAAATTFGKMQKKCDLAVDLSFSSIIGAWRLEAWRDVQLVRRCRSGHTRCARTAEVRASTLVNAAQRS